MNKLEGIWLTVKSFALLGFVVGCFFIASPLVAKVVDFFDKKEQFYNEQIIKLSENAVSKRMEISNSLMKEELKKLRQDFLDLAKQRDQDITHIGNVVAELKQDLTEQIGNMYKDEKDPTKNYAEVVLKKQLSDGSEIPWGWAMYSPNAPVDEKWTTGTYPLKVHTKIALGESEDRSDAYVEAWMTSDVFKDDKDKKFPINIESVDWVKRPPKEKEWMFNPRLSLGFGYASEIFPALELSLFSYGKSEGDMDWRFLSFGVGASDENYYLYTAPVEYNVGKPIPLIDNIFFSPFVGIDKEMSTIFGGQFQIPF